MAHTLTLLTRVRVRRVSLDQGKYRVEGDVFYLLRFYSARWPELAADRLAWQTMLRDGAPPPTFRKPPPPAVPMPIFITLYVGTRVR